MDDPAQAVADVRSLDQARKLHADVERDLTANWESWDVGKVGAHEQALKDLQEMFKTLDRETKRKRTSAGNNEVRADEREARQRKQAAAKKPTQRKRQQTRQRATGRARSRTRREGSWAWRQTGIPGTARSATELALQAVGAFVGLTFAYLLLRNPKAVEGALQGVRTGVKVLIDPVDPIAGKAKPASRVAVVKDAIEDAGFDYVPEVEQPLVPLSQLGAPSTPRSGRRGAGSAIAEAGRQLQLAQKRAAAR